MTIAPDRDSIFNIFSNKRLNPDIAQDIINRDKLGQELYKNFVKEGLVEGKKSIFDPMEEGKIKDFLSTELPSPSKDSTVEDRRDLFHRLSILARSQDIDLKYALGEYEFQVVPKNFFLPHGSLLLATDKSKIMQHIEKLIGDERLNSAKVELSAYLNDSSNRSLIILLDAMHIVNSITRKCSPISTVADYADIFEGRMYGLSRNFDQVRVVFDRYIEGTTTETVIRT